jgi:ubiquitin C-terminal hydrolase
VLLVCLKRFSTERKLDTAVGFEERLDLRPFCRSSIQLASTRCEYALIGVVMHRGNKISGHYWAFVRTEANKWFECDDTRVEEAELARVLEEGSGSGRPGKASAYLLLYRRR